MDSQSDAAESSKAVRDWCLNTCFTVAQRPGNIRLPGFHELLSSIGESSVSKQSPYATFGNDMEQKSSPSYLVEYPHYTLEAGVYTNCDFCSSRIIQSSTIAAKGAAPVKDTLENKTSIRRLASGRDECRESKDEPGHHIIAASTGNFSAPALVNSGSKNMSSSFKKLKSGTVWTPALKPEIEGTLTRDGIIVKPANTRKEATIQQLNAADINQLISTYMAGNQKCYACTVCFKSFQMKGHVKQHIKTVHRRDRKFPCPVPGCEVRLITRFARDQVCRRFRLMMLDRFSKNSCHKHRFVLTYFASF